MKHFLLTAGSTYYPQAATEDWIGCFSTRDEALSKVVVIEHKRVLTKGKNKGQEKITGQSFRVGESIFDWFEIIDIREWMER